MTQHIVATASARGRINTAVLFLRLAQRRNSDHQARRRQLLADDPHVTAEQLRRRAAILAEKVERARSGEATILASRIEVRIEHGETSSGRPKHEAHFVCRCGWTTRSAAPGHPLMIPNRVRDHERVCAYANPGQSTLDDLMRGAG